MMPTPRPRAIAPMAMLVLVACTRAGTAPGVPTTHDAWNALSHELASSGDPSAALETRTPWLWVQLRQDSEHEALLRAWGRSVNFDEHAHATIVAPPLVAALHEATGQRVTPESVHAGVEHTYGYLFSTVETPYGYKRERWVSGAIERGMGLAPGLLGPKPDAGTLLGNVTAFLSRSLGRVAPEAAVAPALDRYDYSRFSGHAEVRERVTDAGQTWELITHLLPFQNPSDKGDLLLVYEAASGEAGHELITAFPVNRKFADTLLSSAGTDVDIRPRYNAFVPGFGDAPRRGERVARAPK